MQRFITILLITFCAHTEAAEKIEGAFGLKLGAPFDPEKAIGKSKLTDGTPMYEFSAASPYRAFKHYYVMITPTTKLIYSIWGGYVRELSNCKKGAGYSACDSQGEVRRTEDQGAP